MLPRREATALDGRRVVDVAIIGAGFAGLAAARTISLLDPTVSVGLLEAGLIGDGPAGANSGFIIDLPHEVSSDGFGQEAAAKFRQSVLLQRSAVALATSIADELSLAKDIFDPCGRYSIAMSAEGDKHLDEYASLLTHMGEVHRRLDNADTAAVTGSKAFKTSLFTPGTAIIHPAAFVRAWADALRSKINVYERSPALSIERSGAAWLIKTPAGSLETGKIILANNGHAQSFGFFRRQLIHVFTYASLTHEFDPAELSGHRKWAATPALPMGTTVRRINTAGGDRILVRSRYSYNPDIAVTPGAISRAGKLHDKKFAHRFPGLRDVGMEYRWAGAMALTRNHVPAFGEVEDDIIAACGCNGLGASNSTASGIAAAELALGRDSDLLQIYRSMPAPTSIPPEPFTTIGARAQLAYREWRAGVE
ncbi:FAD-binding oxidoreductase [Rhizobium leguminosarum]|uniref:NAD(P)/FAD-dependent oxidoreductase n=1 Tax=Rhizobium leguminosarum TaxID=384 RepID=UPI001C96782E|nr:FAD-binding oxidoreductase [Rhizobium leguminosarum]MBY5570706.1 FAD-binding oxidoreductase [Rhizobium leguminosarum]MBY5577271.1 FAD-binding oxidoreductase [Rhizobium leguminosarum]